MPSPAAASCPMPVDFATMRSDVIGDFQDPWVATRCEEVEGRSMGPFVAPSAARRYGGSERETHDFPAFFALYRTLSSLEPTARPPMPPLPDKNASPTSTDPPPTPEEEAEVDAGWD